MKKNYIIAIFLLFGYFNIALADNNKNIDSLPTWITNNTSTWDLYTIDNKKQVLIKKYITQIYDNSKYYQQKEELEIIQAKFIKNNNFKKLNIVKEVLKELDNQNKLFLEYQKENTFHKISIWFSKKWEEIFAYYKWNPDNWFFWIFATIHGWYEYWTYKTATYLMEELEKSWKTWRFIIPVINPDWLKIASKDNFKKDMYIKGRSNSVWIDLNRNFCTDNFQVYSYIKKLETFYSGDYCNSELETQNIVNILENYKFNKVISLHSERARLFIPDKSFYDYWEQSFVIDIKNIFPDYRYPKITDKYALKESEIDEWWSKLYTGSMETYIYEKYKIPVVLLELSKHWQIEYRIKWIIDLL